MCCLTNKEMLSCLQTRVGRWQKYLIRVHLILTYQASCPASYMIDELVLVSVSNYQVPVLHNFEAKMKRTLSRTRYQVQGLLAILARREASSKGRLGEDN